MKKLLRSSVIAAASVASLFSMPHGKKEEPSKHKKHRATSLSRGAATAPPSGGKLPPPLKSEPEPDCTPDAVPEPASAPMPEVRLTESPPPAPAQEEPTVITNRYPWKRDIVTTTFWIGERPSKNNPVPNLASSWDARWASHYGGTDTPDPKERKDFHPAAFIPGENPFYVALPYNDMQSSGHKPEAEKLIPWFKEEYRGPGQSVCKGRWIAIRYKDRVVYAQWEDCGPFRTDHGSYVFGNERPKKNLNKGAGLDVSPAVRDYLGMNDTDVTDWKFVDFEEVPQGPWAQYGANNTFVINERLNQRRLASLNTEQRTAD